MRKTKSQLFAEEWVHELVKTNGHINAALMANKNQQKAIAKLLRAGYADANFDGGDNKTWNGAEMMYQSLDMADVMLALANLIGREAGLDCFGHYDVEMEAKALRGGKKGGNS